MSDLSVAGRGRLLDTLCWHPVCADLGRMVTARDLILDRLSALPPMPTTAARLMELLRDPEVDLARVAAAVEVDPGLTANTLKMANAALLGTTKRIASVREAVSRVGLLRIYQVVVAAVVGPRTRVRLSCYGLGPEELWNHSMAVAASARVLAKASGIGSAEEAFTAGLLHDVGKLLLGLSPAAAAGPLRSSSGETLLDAERARFGADHAEAGGYLLEYWHFPPALAEAVRLHHRPGEDRGAALIQAADIVCRRVGIGCRCTERPEDVPPSTLGRLGMSDETLKSLRLPMERAYGEVRAQFV